MVALVLAFISTVKFATCNACGWEDGFLKAISPVVRFMSVAKLKVEIRTACQPYTARDLIIHSNLKTYFVIYRSEIEISFFFFF